MTNATACTTAKGCIGLVTGSAKQGDLICILYGGKSPFILSKEVGKILEDGQDGHEDLFRLVGEAYIYSVMHGEAMGLKHVQLKKICIV